ncbi:MAG: TauD/TfdA family dioxygenase [Pseudomonadota bacterium]
MFDATAWTLPETTLDPIDIRRAAAESGACCVRGAGLDDAAFVALLERFGPLMFTDGETAVPGHAALNIVTNAGRATPPRSRFHSDSTYFRRPPLFTALRVAEVPRAGGGTVIVDTRTLWGGLPDADKDALRGVRVLHRVSGLDVPEGAETEAWHPLVRRQPETGRAGFFLTVPERMVEAEDDAGRDVTALVHDLYEEALALPAATHHWQAGDLLFWDNRITLHKGDHRAVDGTRTLHRGMVEGEVPEAA